MVAATTHAADAVAQQTQNSDVSMGRSLAAKLGLGADYGFAANGSYGTVRGTQVVRMQPYYKGVPVYDRSVVVEQDAQGNVRELRAAVLQNFPIELGSVVPRLSPAQALSTFRAAHGVLPTVATEPRDEHADLYIYPEPDGRYRLVYLTSYFVGKPASSQPTAMIDASNGRIVKEWEGLARAGMEIFATGPGGNAKIGKYHYGREHPPLIATRYAEADACFLANAHVETYDMKGSDSGYGSLVRFPCAHSEEPELNGAYGPLNDAHHFASVVRDMYQSWFGEPPVDGLITMKVHHGLAIDGPFFAGSTVYLGDGDAKLFPASTLGIIAHEISHGFTAKHSGLPSDHGMNEAFSDMAGEAAKFFDRGENNFFPGSDLFKSIHGAFRDMCEPTRDGRSIDNLKDYAPGLDGHYSSGIYNKAFCLLAKTPGWNTRKAFEAFGDANIVHWSASETFTNGACGVEQAADDLGYSRLDVIAAFADVGVSCAVPIELLNGLAVQGLAGELRSVKNYWIKIPSGARNLRISIAGGVGNEGDAQLYVKRGAQPTVGDWDCRPDYLNHNNHETCSYSGATPAGNYYVQLRGAKAYSGVKLKAGWEF